MLRVLRGIFLARVSIVDFPIIEDKEEEKIKGLASLGSLVDFSGIEDEDSIEEGKMNGLACLVSQISERVYAAANAAAIAVTAAHKAGL